MAYWTHGLGTAQRWRERLGMKRKVEWDRVIARLSSLPVRDGVYLAHENCPQTYTERNYDHPSMLGALGMLPGEGVDRATVCRTLDRVMKKWQWETTWGWDYPLSYAIAMMAAGWRGAPLSHAPGFPEDGSWTVRWEKLNSSLLREL